MGVYQMLSNTWTFEPFVDDDDGTVYLRLGLHGDHGDYASAVISAADVDRANRHFGDVASRLDECSRLADEQVASGAWTWAQRDEFLKQRCVQLMSRLDVAVDGSGRAVRGRREDLA